MFFTAVRYTLLAILLCLSALMTSCLSPQQLIINSDLSGDQVWAGVVYIEGDITLKKDAKLTILPGTKIRFLSPGDKPGNRVDHPYFPGSELNIEGRVTAIGTPAEPIIFESADPDAAAGSWGAVNLDGSEEAIFEYCIFRQADSAIHSRESDVYIEHSLFENNLVAVRFHTSNILVEHNLIRNNHTGIRFHFGSPVVCENVFSDNHVNIFITSYPQDYLIENNTFGPAGEYQVVLGEQVPDDVLLLRNFWVTDVLVSPQSHFYDGHRSNYLGNVLVDPVRSSPSSQVGPSWNP